LIKDEEGKEMILSYLNQGDFIGELGLFEEQAERTNSHSYHKNKNVHTKPFHCPSFFSGSFGPDLLLYFGFGFSRLENHRQNATQQIMVAT